MNLETAIAHLAYRPDPFPAGHVWLAGAGPGDPGCLTLQVLAALSQADCVVHDALISDAVLAAAPQAERRFAGKRAGRPSTGQDDISRMLVDLARQGRRVLRLKGGDPFVFGRGGEEALALVEAGVPFRVLPGLTSAFAALAGARIPATMRGTNKAIVLATGHAAGTDEDLDWAALARAGQPIVVYMGLRTLPVIADALLAGGLAPDLPAAVIEQATTAREKVLVAPLSRIAAEAARAGLGAPALIVVGEIVALRAVLADMR